MLSCIGLHFYAARSTSLSFVHIANFCGRTEVFTTVTTRMAFTNRRVNASWMHNVKTLELLKEGKRPADYDERVRM